MGDPFCLQEKEYRKKMMTGAQTKPVKERQGNTPIHITSTILNISQRIGPVVDVQY